MRRALREWSRVNFAQQIALVSGRLEVRVLLDFSPVNLARGTAISSSCKSLKAKVTSDKYIIDWNFSMQLTIIYRSRGDSR